MIIKKLFILGLFILSTFSLNAQPDKTYTSFEEALQTPEQVYKLSTRISHFPESIGQLKNLKELSLGVSRQCCADFRRLKMTEAIGQLKNLEVLKVNDRKIELSESIAKLTNLKELYLNDLNQ